MSISLTSKEIAVLVGWPTNYDSAESEKGDNATWNEVADVAKYTGLSVASSRSVVASLVKKGLVEGGHEKANGVAGELQVLTEAGIDVVFSLRTKEEGAEVAVDCRTTEENGPAEEGAPREEAPAEKGGHEKLVLADLQGNELVSRRRTFNTEVRALLHSLAANHSGEVVSMETLRSAYGLDADGIANVVRRSRSWFGPKRVEKVAGGLQINLSVKG